MKKFLAPLLVCLLFFSTAALGQYNPAGFSQNPTFTTVTTTGAATIGGNASVKSESYTRTAVADAAHTQIATESIIAYTSLSATRNVTLITSGIATGQLLIIKDESGLAGTDNITTSGVTVDGANPSITTNYGVLRMYFNGTNYSSY